MQKNDILYFDGTSILPSKVRVLFYSSQLHLHKDDDPHFYASYPIEAVHHNEIGSHFYFYLDKAGLKYLQMPADEPLVPILKKDADNAKGSWHEKLLKQKGSLLVAVLLGVSLGLYLLIVTLVPYTGMKVISIQQEISLGNRLKDVMLHEATLLESRVDEKGSAKLQEFADKLQLSPKYPIRVTLLNSDVVNAYALPGGNIVVYRGIIKELKTFPELVALLCHESTHINERHSLRAMLRSTSNAMILSVIFGDASGISGALVSNADALNGLRYSRSLETEADTKGMELMTENGIDATGMQLLMERLNKVNKLPGSLSFLSTHPLTKERIALAGKYARQHQHEAKDRTDLQMLFDELQKMEK